MNLNKWLCKTFDTDKKGYVTVSDVAQRLLAYTFYSGIILIISTLLYYGAVFVINIKERFNPDSKEIDIPGFLGFIIWIVFILITSAYVWDTKISKIKIAKCPLRENENK